MVDIEYLNKNRWLIIVKYPWISMLIIFITSITLFFMYRNFTSDLNINLKYEYLVIENNQILINHNYDIKNIDNKNVIIELHTGIKYTGYIKKSYARNIEVIITENCSCKYIDADSKCKITISNLKLFEWLELKKVGV